MMLKAEGGGVKNVIGTVTVPADWPNEQRVREVKREIPPGATVELQTHRRRWPADVGEDSLAASGQGGPGGGHLRGPAADGPSA